ncbi:hypothetical protein VTK73DRAFT_9149 [Phialemonium thermophilum]|uniref:Zn(2)-C6 fungal-type domain-containing protein n=1 Tax=Phialemonium thermophilum TaxID=223376 RepID=A0ABR3XMR0_9PEZI
MLNQAAISPSVDSDAGASSGDDADSSHTAKRQKPSFNKTSCDLCKARKVRCDKILPSCTWCAKHGRDCVYRERARPGSKLYNVDLEAKVNRIDAMLQMLGRRVEDHIAESARHPHGSCGSCGLQGRPSLAHHTPESSSHPSSLPANSSGGLGLTPGYATPTYSTGATLVQPATMSSMSRTSVQSLIHASPPSPQSQSSSHQPPPSADMSANRQQRGEAALASEHDLPAPEVIYTLVDLYFKHVNTWCPILERKTTFSAFFGSTMLTEANRVLLHAIVATTLRFYRDSGMTREAKEQYHRASKQRVQSYAFENTDLAALKALVILSLDVLGTSNGPLGWNLLAMIVRNVIQLDLCTENSVYLTSETTPRTGSVRRVILPRPESWVEDEGRRRLCWMVYILDRYATLSTPFDFILDDRLLDLALPCRYDQFSNNVPVETRSFRWGEPPQTAQGNPTNSANVPAGRPLVNNPENLGSFSYHCEVLRILSRVHNFLREPLDVCSPTAVQAWRSTYRRLDADLNSWLQSLPGEYGSISKLCHSDPASRVANWIMLHAAFVMAVIRLHSSAAYPALAATAPQPATAGLAAGLRSPLVASLSPSSMPGFAVSPGQSFFTPSQVAVQRCIGAARSLRDIAADVLETNGLDLLGPPFAFALWVSARVLIVHAAAVGARATDPTLDFLISTLRQMGTHWDVAENYARILTDVVAEAQTGQTTFSEMRKCASEIADLASKRRQSNLDPTTTRLTSAKELDYVDVFDFFNYPKVANPSAASQAFSYPPVYSSGEDRLPSVEKSAQIPFEAPGVEADWLTFQPPHD